jgi:hypothetical protein
VIAFRPTLGASERLPLLDVFLTADCAIAHTCLLDTGAVGVRLSADFAYASDIPLPREPNAPDVIAGATRSQVYAVEHPLFIEVDGAPLSWTARVSFCDPWPHPFGLLGRNGFFDVFDVLVQGHAKRFEVRRPR